MVWSAPSGEVLIDIVSRPGQTEHGHGALAYGGKQTGVAPARPSAPYAPSYPSALRLHQPYGSAALSYRDSYARGGGGAAGEYRAGARMSLLGSAYLAPPAPPAHHPPPADPPPFKKIRLAAERPAAKHQLRVDTREPVMNSYNNTVEVLSPNPPSEHTIEDQSFRTTKDDLLQQISKVDREMALSETTLQKLKKKQEELEQSASKPALTEEPEEAPPRHRSLAQCIYADNRKRAAAAHAVLAHLGPPVLYPLYNQPEDTAVYHENIRKHRAFRRRLADHLKTVRLETEKREDALTEEYSRRAAEWLRRVDRIEQGQKRKTKDARNREFFEKVFPELRKAREERERFNRLGARVKSEAELEEIADGLHEQEHEDKKMRSLTVVPPLLRDPRLTRHNLDTNKRCMDMETEYKELKLRNVWTRAEKEMFREKYLQHPKNFGQIASFLPRKSVRDCVRFYYLSKKAENYKQLLRKPRPRRHARPRPAPEPELPAGVTTRLQRIQGSARVADKDASMDELSQPADTTPVDLIPVPPAAPAHPARSELSRTPPLPPSPPPGSSAPPAATTDGSPSALSGSSGLTGLSGPSSSPGLSGSNCSGSDGLSNTSGLIPMCTSSASLSVPNALASTSSAVSSLNVSVVTSVPGPIGSPVVSAPTPPACEAPATPLADLPPVTVAASTPTVITTTSAPSGGAVMSCMAGSKPPTPQPAQPPTPTHPPPTPEPAMTERTSTPSSTIPPSSSTTTTVTTLNSACAVCSANGATRAVAPSRAGQYGLDPSMAGARVCEACHCRFVRARRSRCTVPSCAGPRAKRLRHLPPRWHDLPLELKRPLMDDFQIPSDLSKCCLTCFKRITRRLDSVGEGGSAPEPTEDEAAGFRTLLREHGTAWERMSAASGKTPASLKAFYFTYRKKLQLDVLLSERQPSRGSETDDSILSSGDTDTASADSPRPPPLPGPRTDAVAPRRHRRDEYDSSATETADEENDAPSAKTIAPAPAPVVAMGAGIGVPGATSSNPGTVSVSVSSAQGPIASVGTPLTVRDVVLNMIEVSLMRNSRPVPPHPNPQTMNHQHSQPTKVPTHEPLATLTVVSGAGHASSPHSPRSPHRGATITPLPPDGKDVMLLHIEPRPAAPHHLAHAHPHPHPHAPADPLDLSEKRPRHEPPKPQHRNAEYAAYRAAERQSPTQYNSKPKPVASPRPSLKLAANPKGSITLGTPVETRYEPQRIPSDPKTGSITAGTPVHGPHHLPEKRNLEYRRRSPGGAYYAGAGSQPRPQSPSSFQNATATAVSRGTYGLERRQIMLTDYITSQQMHGVVRREREPSHHHQQQHQQHQQQQQQQQHQQLQQQQHQHQQQQHQQQQQQQHQQQQQQQQQHQHQQQQQQHQQQQHQQQLQHQHQHQPIRRDRDTVSVIQKHTHTYSHPHPPPGHEAFAQLVNAASVAPALPVPRREEPAPEPPPASPLHHAPHPPHMHHDIRASREFSMSQKYHPQYTTAERRAPPPQQRDVRDSRERMVPMQERHYVIEQHQSHQQHQQHQQHQPHQHQQHAQQLLIDRHLIPTHSQNMSSGEERRGSSGSGGAAGYGAPGKRPIHQLDRKDGRTAASAVSTPGGGAGAAPAPGAAGGGAAAGAELSAASLINAIITQKISQTSNQRFPSKIIRESDGVVPQSDRMLIDHQRDRDRESERDRDRENDGPPQLTAHTTSMKLGDLASNIIVRDFSSPNTNSLLHHNNRFAVSSADTYAGGAGVAAGAPGAGPADEWRRDAPKHAPYLEPVSPPDNHHTGRGGARRYSAAHVGGGSVLTAYDYVTTRIVEVMRNDEERSKPPFHPPTSYAYPYSALNVATPATDGTAVSGGASPAAPLPAPVQPEPAPLMSAQYEPLSDED